LDVAAELEAIFEEAEVGDESFGAGGFDFGDDGLQAFVLDGLADYSCEIFNGADGARFWNAGGAGDGFQISAGACGRGKAADGEETFVVKNDVEEIFWFVAGEGAEAAEVHEERAVAVEDDNFLSGQGESEAEAGGRGQSHSVLQIEKIGTMAEGLEFSGKSSHDGDDETFFEVGVDGAETV